MNFNENDVSIFFQITRRPKAVVPKTACEAPVPKFHGGSTVKVLINVPQVPDMNQRIKKRIDPIYFSRAPPNKANDNTLNNM